MYILYILYIFLLCFCFNISRSGLAVETIHCSIPCSLPSSSESRSVWTLRSSSPSRWSRTLVTHRTLIPDDATRWRTSAALSATIHSENERRAFQNRHSAEVNALLEYQGILIVRIRSYFTHVGCYCVLVIFFLQMFT